MYNFDLVRPTTIADAVAAMGQEGAQALGGGQTLLPTMKQRLASPETLVSLTAIGEIQGVCLSDDGKLCIGGGAPRMLSWHARRQTNIRGWQVLPAISAIRRCAPVAPSAAALPITTHRPATLRLCWHLARQS